ncbi:hypothetical protein RRG08_004174 [Elysia crispata]|uniref:MADF domain-containing protein n=1 Tax=Elysia crispata TaxID=231223 RepID=A0AAE1D6M1_9GAST|nr:hypothetical protein RRG08_004174 [Elysia crispata]
MDTLNEALIAAVQKRQPLYDKSDDNYSNRVFIAKQWQEIGQEIGINDQTARKKWTTLRDYFQKTHRQLTNTKSGSGTEKHRKWYLYDSLLFLLPHIGDRASSSNLSPDQLEENEPTFSVGDNSQDRSSTLSPAPSTSTQSQAVEVHAQPLLTPTPSAARKRKYPQERYAANPVDEKMLETISNIGTRIAQKEVLDEDEHFCRSLVSKIKSLDPFSKLECQAEIQMVILRYMRRSVQGAEGRQTHTYRSSQGSDYDQYQYQYQTFDLGVHPTQ